MSGDYYDEHASEFSATRDNLRWEILHNVQKLIDEETRLLDIGCGSGRLLAHINLEPDQYVGIDASQQMIEQAQKRWPAYTFKTMDMRKMEFPESSYSVVCLIASLHHLQADEHTAVLENIFKILQPGGCVYMTNWDLYREPPYDKVVVQKNAEHVDWIIPKGENRRFYYGFTVEEINDLLERVGFLVKQGELSHDNLIHLAQKPFK